MSGRRVNLTPAQIIAKLETSNGVLTGLMWFFIIAMAVFLGLWLWLPSPIKNSSTSCAYIGQTGPECKTCATGYINPEGPGAPCSACAPSYEKEKDYTGDEKLQKCVKVPDPAPTQNTITNVDTGSENYDYYVDDY